jgi:hypothetical protein
VTPEQELDGLKGQAESLEETLGEVKKRMEDLESRKTSKD